jgi:competence protein ComEA
VELMALPGIGAVTAERIIAFREDSSRFRSIDELKRVKGISKRKLEQLRPLITVE